MRNVFFKFCANLIAFLTFPSIVFLVYWADQTYKVVEDFKIATQVTTPGGVLIEGIMDKQRNCRLIEVVAILDDNQIIPVVFLDPGTPPMYKRPTGVQKWGPWLIIADPKQGVKLHAYHRCHVGWEHSTTLTTFVVGVQ